MLIMGLQRIPSSSGSCRDGFSKGGAGIAALFSRYPIGNRDNYAVFLKTPGSTCRMTLRWGFSAFVVTPSLIGLHGVFTGDLWA
jgi:hypothetical protein